MLRIRVLTVASSLLLLLACKRSTEQAAAVPAPPPAAETVAASAPASAPAPAQPPPAVAAPTATPAGGLATQETNWKGISATVTEFRRKGNTLTAKVRYANSGAEELEPDVSYKEVYLIDTTGGKKYEVLKDEKGAYIAGLRSGWDWRWYSKIKPGESHTIWMKFPAPPAELKAITLQLPNMPPFEDVAIQD